jgi:hypothetical protein
MGAVIKPMRHNRGRLPAVPCQAAATRSAGQRADGLKRLSGRGPRQAGANQSIIMCPDPAPPWVRAPR